MTVADDIPAGEFVDKIVALTIDAAITSMILGGYRRFTITNWSIRSWSFWEEYCEKKYIERYAAHHPRTKKITIPGTKMIRRPKKPK